MTIWRMRISCCKTKATDRHSEYVILIAFQGNNSYANAPQCYVYTYIARFASLVEILMLESNAEPSKYHVTSTV